MGFLKSAIGALRRGLGKTRETFVGALRSLVAGRRVDDELLDEIEALLIKGDVGVQATTAIVSDLRGAARRGEIERGEDVIEFLKRRLKSSWRDDDRSIARTTTRPAVILVVGVNGAGKTTSVAKIARSLRGDGRSVLLAAADTFRAGAVEQLSLWSERLGVPIVKGRTGADPASVAFDAVDAALARDVDVLLIDTAGRLHTQDHLMRELTKIRDVVRRKIPDAPHEVLLVLDATSGQNAINQARIFAQAVNVTGIFLAKLDGTAKGGIVIAIRDALGIPVKLVGLGETPDDVAPFDPESFVDEMFGG